MKQPFEFEDDFEELDERSIFANRVCKLIFDKNEGNLDKAIQEAEPYLMIWKNLSEIYMN